MVIHDVGHKKMKAFAVLVAAVLLSSCTTLRTMQVREYGLHAEEAFSSEQKSLSKEDEQIVKTKMRQMLITMGMPFPKGARVVDCSQPGTMKIMNTRENLNRFEELYVDGDLGAFERIR
jgi:hypothetical protein